MNKALQKCILCKEFIYPDLTKHAAKARFRRQNTACLKLYIRIQSKFNIDNKNSLIYNMTVN